ncbi:hypothetical protein [Archangium primigenium]|uniref:hypothetical protein n=1 Tax=[Archangium] primigenium TaxID=2792470 RepID=UPI00195BC1C2|nr:hypothetical protein [Archangium primigenium]MBM7112494.1 hypothetical protein [Archangium primigenium]
MDGSRSSSLRNEPNLTHGEQRILALLEAWGPRLERLEQGQQRLEQRMERVEQRLERVEQRLDALEQRMERVEQRLDLVEHRLQDLEEKVSAQGRELRMLTSQVEIEAAASKQRDRQFNLELLRYRDEEHLRLNQLRDSWFKELQFLRASVTERLDQHNTRLEMLEQAVQRLGDQLAQAFQRQWAPLPTA